MHQQLGTLTSLASHSVSPNFADMTSGLPPLGGCLRGALCDILLLAASQNKNHFRVSHFTNCNFTPNANSTHVQGQTSFRNTLLIFRHRIFAHDEAAVCSFRLQSKTYGKRFDLKNGPQTARYPQLLHTSSTHDTLRQLLRRN